MKPLKILACSDIHGDTSAAERLAQQAEQENVDLVVLCGDLTYMDSSTDGIIGPFAKRDRKVVLIPGNHESVATADFLAEVYGATNLHGYAIRHNEVGLFGCGGANIGIHQLGEEEIFGLLEKGHERVKDARRKILVSHVHPTGSISERFTDFFAGSDGLRKAVEQFSPDVLLCGHVHEAEGIEDKIGDTKVYNLGKKGRIIEL